MSVAEALHQFATKFLSPIITIAAAVSVLWAVLTVIVAKNSLHLLVVVKHDKESFVVYPVPPNNLVLPLEYHGTRVDSLRIARVEVVNHGKETIGSAGDLWHLTLTGPDGSMLVPVGTLEVTPSPVAASTDQSVEANAISLSIGAFQPRASVKLRVMLLNAPVKPETVDLMTIATSLPGLPKELSRLDPPAIFIRRLLFPMTVAVFLLLVPDLRRDIEKAKRAGKKPNYLKEVMGRLMASALVGIIAAMVVGWGLSWFL